MVSLLVPLSRWLFKWSRVMEWCCRRITKDSGLIIWLWLVVWREWLCVCVCVCVCVCEGELNLCLLWAMLLMVGEGRLFYHLGLPASVLHRRHLKGRFPFYLKLLRLLQSRNSLFLSPLPFFAENFPPKPHVNFNHNRRNDWAVHTLESQTDVCHLWHNLSYLSLYAVNVMLQTWLKLVEFVNVVYLL